jgi:hypothetical protein
MNYTKVSLLLLTAACLTIQAKQHIWFNDSVFQDGFFSLFDLHENAFDLDQWEDYGLSKEDRELVKNARQNLANIAHTIEQDAQNPKIAIKVAGFKTLDPKEIKVAEQNKGWNGLVTTKDGTVEFFISRHGFTLSRQVEIKRDAPTAAQKDAKTNDVEKVFHISSMNSVGEYFKYPVDVTTLKVESITDTTLTLTIEKKRERTLPLPIKTQDKPTVAKS